MKRNELLAKSLTLGLAVATAATSMSVPGGLLAPETVYAEETGTEEAEVAGNSEGETTGAGGSQSEGKVTLTKANVTDYFRLMSDYVVIPESGDAKVIWGYSLKHANDGATYVGTPTFTLKNENNEVTELSNLRSEKEYTVYVSVTGGSEVEATKTPVELGTVTAYTEFADTLTYKNGAEGEAVTDNISGKYFTKDVYVSAGDGATVGRSVAELDETYKEAYPVDYFTNADNQSKDTVGSGVTLLIQKAGKTYIKEVMINFTRTPEISDFSVLGDSVKDVSATLSVTFNKAGKAYYVVKPNEVADITAEQIKSDSDKKDVDTLTADTAQKIAVASLKANTSYYVYIAAEDSYKNLSDVQHVTFTTAKPAITGTAKLTGDATIGSKLTASVEGGAADVSYKYEFVRIATDRTETTVQAASENASYTITKEDKGSQISVIVTADDYSDILEETTDTVAAVKVTKDKVKDYVDYTDITEGLIYNGEDQTDSVGKTVKIKEKYADEIELSDFYLTKSSETQKAEFVGAGTYDVYVALAGNYETEDPVKIGTAVINKYQPNVDDIVVLNQTQTYTGSKIDAEMKSCYYLLDESKVKITYKQAGQDVAEPINAGTYDIYVAYPGDYNCEALVETKKNSTLTIEKATDHSAFSPLVVKADTVDNAEYNLAEAVAKWTLSETDKNVHATVKVDGAYASYIEELKYADGKVSFKLSDAGKALTEQKEFAIHVDFGESFTNYNVAFDLPVIITDKTPVDISIKDNVSNLIYDGNAKTISYEVKQGETPVEGAAGKLNVTITKNGKSESEIKDAGTYVVTAEYKADDKYGKLVQEITVAPKAISSTGELKKYFKIGDLNLTYDMTDHGDAIFDAVGIVEESGIENNDYDVRIAGDTVNAGDAIAVSINTWGGNYYTDDYVDLGTVKISKGTIKLKVTADAKGTPTITVGDKTIANDACELKYYDNAGKELAAKPTAPGTYKVKVTYTDDKNLTAPAEGEATFTISGGNTSVVSPSGGSSVGGGAATTPSKDDTKKDDTKKDTTTKTETKPDGTKVTTTETKAADGSVQTKIELKNDTAGVDATVNVAKDAQGKVTGVTADVNQTATDKQTAISAATVAQITEAAGTKDVAITTKTVDANGKTVREVTVNASDLTAGKKLKVVAVDPKTGEKTLVNKTTYKVAADGSLALDNLGNDSYEVVTTAEVNALTKEILQSIRPEKSKANIAAGKKTTLSLDDALNMDNVAKIAYKTSKKSVATVNPNGTVTARKEGKVTIKAIVTLNNGKKKTVRMNLTVKARK